MSLFGSQTASTQNRRLLGFHPQTSISGQVISILFGTRKMSGNVIWTGDWRNYTIKTAGGKGSSKASSGGKGGSSGANLGYKTAIMMELCRGEITGVRRIWLNKTQYVNAGGTTYTPVGGHLSSDGTLLTDLNLSFFNGQLGQTVWGYLETNHAAEALTYSEIAYVASPDLDLGSSGVTPQLTYELTGKLATYNGGLDCDPAAVSVALMSDPILGAGLADSDIGDPTQASNYAVANGLFCSPLLDTQQTAANWLNDLALIGNFAFVNSEAKIKLVTYGDTTASGNGATFTPNITPIYDLDDDDFLAEEGEEPVTVTIPSIRDNFNSVTVEWLNRDNQYNEEPVTEQDDAEIQQYGLRQMPTVQAHAICDHAVASKVCNLTLKNSAHKRRRFQFTLGIQYDLLEPMDMVTISDSYLGLDHEPVRILTIEEGEEGRMSVTAEEFPFGLATPAIHPKQTTSGYAPGYFALPGDIYPPIFIEAPAELTQDVGHELLIGLSGGPNWGGCTVWESVDGDSYESVGRFLGPSLMGVLTADLPSGTDPDTANTLSVNLTQSFGQVATVSQESADQNRTLFVIGKEFVSFETATLSGTYKYDLTYLRRGVFGTRVASHASGSRILSLVDLTFSFPYQSTDIGQARYFKFTSFNKAGQQEQLLADVTAYQHQIVDSASDPPDPWLAHGEDALTSPDDPMYGGRGSFGIVVDYDSDAAGNPYAIQDIYGFYPTNVLSEICEAPVVSPVLTTSTTGGFLVPGRYRVEICAIDDQTPHQFSARSVTATIVIPPGTNTNTITATIVSWDSHSTAAFGYLSLDDEPFGLSGISGTTPPTLTFVGMGASQAPPDTQADHLHIQCAEEVAGWRWILQITAISTDGLTLTFAGQSMATNEFQGCILSIVGRGDPGNVQRIANTVIASCGGPTVVVSDSLTGQVIAGDYVACRLKLSTHSLTQFGDSGIINSVATSQGFPSGYDSSEFAGNYAYVAGGTGAGQWGTIASNAATVFTLKGQWSRGIAVDASSIVILLDQAFDPDFPTPPVKSDGNNPFLAPKVASVKLRNYAGKMVFTRVLTESLDNVVGDATFAPFRETYIAGQPGPGAAAPYQLQVIQ